MQIVTGYRGEMHITSNDEQGKNQGIFGTGNYVLSVGNQFRPTLISANELRIADGEGVMQGVHFRVDPNTYDTVTITNGTQGQNRIDLVVARYTKNASTGVENVGWVVLRGTPTSGTPSAPATVNNDILKGALTTDFPFFRVQLSGLTVQSVTSLFALYFNTNAKSIIESYAGSSLAGSTQSVKNAIDGIYNRTAWAFSNNTPLTDQVDALPNTKTIYYGWASSYQHQAEMDIPVNAHVYIEACKYSDVYATVRICTVNSGFAYASWGRTKNSSQWGEWVKGFDRIEFSTLQSSVDGIAIRSATTSLNASQTKIKIVCGSTGEHVFFVFGNGAGNKTICAILYFRPSNGLAFIQSLGQIDVTYSDINGNTICMVTGNYATCCVMVARSDRPFTLEKE